MRRCVLRLMRADRKMTGVVLVLVMIMSLIPAYVAPAVVVKASGQDYKECSNYNWDTAYGITGSNSSDYFSLSDGSTISFGVEMLETGDLIAEIFDSGERYFTTVSNGRAWIAGDGKPNGSLSGHVEEGEQVYDTIMAGTRYNITAKREGTRYTIQYIDYDKKKVLKTYILSGSDMAEGDVQFHVNVGYGSARIYNHAFSDGQVVNVGQRTGDYYFTDTKVLTVVPSANDVEFRASIKDTKNNPGLWISTASNGSAWYTPQNMDVGDALYANPKGTKAVGGHVYKITFTRSGTDFTVEYYDYTNQEVLHKIYANNTILTHEDGICAYVKTESSKSGGSVEVFEGSPEQFGFEAGSAVEIPPEETTLDHGVDRTRYVSEGMLKTTIEDGYDVNPDTQGKAKDGEYSKYFLKDDLQEVRIQMDPDNLDYVLQNAMNKASAMTDSVTIGGKTVRYTSLKTKGNATRTAETNPTKSDRFSFTVNFGKYIKKSNGYSKKQNFFGLGKVSFNNFADDKTMMREYNSFRLMTEMGIPTPEYGLAKLYINDEYYGVYFMIEPMESSILERFYKVSDSELSSFLTKPKYYSPRYYPWDLDQYKDSSTGKLTGNSLLSAGLNVSDSGQYSCGYPLRYYCGIWEDDDETLTDVAEDLPTVLNWLDRITCLSNGKDYTKKTGENSDGSYLYENINVNSDTYLERLGEVMDIDEVLRYFAAHSFVVQMDNLFTWRQNYGLYVDKEGKFKMIPWDYDLSWGYGDAPSDGESVANWNVDKLYNTVARNYHTYLDDLDDFYAGSSPYFDLQGNGSGYPLFNVIWQNSQLREKFHTYMNDCAKIVTLGGKTSFGKKFDAGRFQKKMADLYDKVVQAASEEMPDHVFYVHGYTQPSDCKTGMKGLSRLMGLRAVGVWLQLKNIRGVTVTGYGYPAGCLGLDSGSDNFTTSGNNIAVVNPDTGIFTIADYAVGRGENDTDDGPVLSVDTLKETDAVYKKIQSKMGTLTSGQELLVYAMKNAKAPSSEYQVYIPLSRQFAQDGAGVYTFNAQDSSLTKIDEEDITTDDNIYSFSTDNISYVALVKNAGDGTNANANKATFSVDEGVTSIDVYDTQDYTQPDAENVTYCYAKNAETATAGGDGEDQVNFRINLADGYIVDTVEVTPIGSYNSIKDPADTNKANVWRVTKVSGNIEIRVVTKLKSSLGDVTEYTGTFDKDDGVASIDVYDTQDYSSVSGLNVSSTTAKNSASGIPLGDGSDQINFKIHLKEGFELDSVSVTPSGAYANIKDFSAQTAGVWRITKIKGNITITIRTREKSAPGESSTPGETTPAPGESSTPGETAPAPTATAMPTATVTPAPTQNTDQTTGSEDAETVSVKKATLSSVKNVKGRSMKITWKKVSGAKGYQVQYALNKKFTQKKKSKITSKTSLTVKKLTKKKTYYVRVRAYKMSGSKKVYGKWSGVKKVKIKK